MRALEAITASCIDPRWSWSRFAHSIIAGLAEADAAAELLSESSRIAYFSRLTAPPRQLH